MTRILLLSAVLAFGGSAALACSNASEATHRYDRALAAYFAKSASLTPAQHTTWSDALRSFQTAVGQRDYASACKALDDASVLIGI